MDSDILLLTDEDVDIYKMTSEEEEEEENNYNMDISSSPSPPTPSTPIDSENDNPSPTHPIPTYVTEHHRPLVNSRDTCHPSSSFSTNHYHRNRYPSKTFNHHHHHYQNRMRRPPSPHSFMQTHNFMIASTTDKGYTLTFNSAWRSRYQHFGIAEWTNDVLNFMRYHPVEIIYVPNRITQRRVMQVIENSVPVCLIPVPPHIFGDSRKMASYIAYLLNRNTIYHRRTTPYRKSMRYMHYSSPLNRRYFLKDG